jgi:ubiquinone/menaquinone biosynthesis C-methylase UbiE
MLIGGQMDSFQELGQNFINPNMKNEPTISLINSIPEKGLILDAGAGDGKIARLLQDINRPIICLDIVKPEKMKVDCQYILGTIDHIPFKDGVFNSVYCLSVLQLVKDNHACFKEFHRILKPGGTVFLTIPTKYSVFHVLRKLEIIYNVYQFPEFNVPHYYYYSKRELYNLSSSFFSILKIKGYSFNFIPRLIIFLWNLLKKYGLFKDKKYNINKNRSINTDNSLSPKKWNFGVIFNKINELLSRFFPDIAYHYIVIFLKRVDP